ncbi:hypothetical protein Sme01_08860 [Sphaerisporangium melleum]|uniref:PD-(D/E)XK endonuclease-like domain-containing protein n=1 Tax=Sphaerisporangium melleum TaxID=321316 RepID=A0A917QWH5_9ACTN|nr:PD-(D/E)XK nuclease family protein [Sphaerisporangium melleum]GGK71803.1 hypothetical protein GCM10007964_13330 [Sphaerisporangium melleum]GII68410.1 hypothetical protein Sme01_08860 [Sphaerisporangium melleum]
MKLPPDSALTGNPDVVRLSTSLFDRRPDDCRDFAAVKARPHVWPAVYEKRRYAPWESFPLGVVMRALDDVEFDGADADEAVEKAVAANRTPLHPSAAAWVRHAVHTYLEAGEDMDAALAAEGVTLRPERLPRVVQGGRSPMEMRVLTAWGRWYATADGSVVEFRRMRMRMPYGRPDAVSTQAVAYVAAAGRRVTDPGDLYTLVPVPVLREDTLPARVRVVEVGLTTGLDKVLLDMTSEEVQQGYRTAVRPAAAALLAGGPRVPGQDCADCKTRASCGLIVPTPGLLGLGDRGTHRRTWSITTARRYQVCPAQSHLRDLRVPGEGSDSVATQRGLDVHRWLEVAHWRGRPCTPADLPEPGAADCGIADTLMDRQRYHKVRPYLLQHIRCCPLAADGEITDVQPERRIATYDATADVVVLADPDLLRRVNGLLVYREQKTSAAPRGITADNALHMVPQLALAVCLIAAGVFGEATGLVELEQLTPESAEVITLDAADPAVVAAARSVVNELVRDWHHDVEFHATPGPWCAFCPVARWCGDAFRGVPSTSVDLMVDLVTGEILTNPHQPDTRMEAIAEAVAEPELDEPPF